MTKYLTLGFILTLCISTQAQVTSNFNVNDEGWTAPNAVSNQIFYTNTGGNPGGFIYAFPDFVPAAIIPPFPVYFYFTAPPSFLGNFTTYYNGNITFDLRQATVSTPVVRPEVWISNGASSIYYFPSVPFNPPSASWATYSVPLSSVSGAWKTAPSDTGPAATQAQIQSILSNITFLGIRGRFNTILSPGYTGVDNVVFQPPITITTQPVNQSACVGTNVVLNTVAAGNNNLTYQWQIFNIATGGYNNLTNGAVYSGVTNNLLNINTTSLLGAASYRCQVGGTNAVSIFTNVAIVTVNPNPSPPSTTGNAACGPSAIALNASGGSPGQYRWYTVPSGGTAIAGQTNSTYLTPALAVTTNYYAAINNGTCESNRTLVVATINVPPTAPTTTGNGLCGSGSMTLSAAGGSAGQYRWYTLPSGGTAIAGETNTTYTTPVLSATTNYYVAINNGTCESNRSLVVAAINAPPLAPTTTGNSRCGNGSVTLSAAGGSAGQYRWYILPSGGAAFPGETSDTFSTSLLTGSANYYVAINNGTCESNRTLVTATINIIPSAPSTTGNSRCGSGSVILSASGGAAGQYRWYTLPSGGTAITGETNSTYATPAIVSTTDYYVSVNDGTCESARTTVTATINTVPTAPIATGSNRCSSGPLTLSASGGTNGQYVWYNIATGGTAISGETNSTYITPNLTATTTYYVAINNGSCESSRTAVIATIGGTVCNNNPPTIAPSSTSTTIAGIANISLTSLINDPDGNLDPTSIKINTPPASGAKAQIINGVLTIDYSGLSFSGQDKITIEACDLLGSCTLQELLIDVSGEINIYNGFSPNGDPFNEKWIIENIESLPETRSNTVSIFNRWGDLIFEIENYNNQDRVFKGINKDGNEVTSGVYFYKIEFTSGRKSIAGYLTIQH